MTATTYQTVDESFERMVAGMRDLSSDAMSPDVARRMLWLDRLVALVVAGLCVVAVMIGFASSALTGLTLVAISPVVVLAAVVTVDRTFAR